AVAQVQPFEPAARLPGALHADDLVATRDERLDQMTADEPRSARHHRAHADLLDVALAEQSRAQRSRRGQGSDSVTRRPRGPQARAMKRVRSRSEEHT